MMERVNEVLGKLSDFHPQFDENAGYDLDALAVYEKGWQNHFAEWCAVGSDRPYHYLGSGKFFVRFGDALATSMAELIDKQ